MISELSRGICNRKTSSRTIPLCLVNIAIVVVLGQLDYF